MDTLFDRVRPDRDAPATPPRPRRRTPSPSRRPSPRTGTRPDTGPRAASGPSHATPSVAALRLEPLPLWLAERADPTLARAPMVAADEGRVLHANPPARRHGITRGMRLDGALLRAPHLHVVAAREPDLARAWREVLHELAGWTPWVAEVRRGLALLRLHPGEAASLAKAFHARVGVASDRHSAELASASAVAGQVRSVTAGDEAAFLARLPLRFLRALGLGEGDLTRLHWLGLQSVGDLARWSEPQLRGYLGAAARPLLPYLHGPRDACVPVWTAPVQLRRDLRFDEPQREPWQLDPAIERLAVALEEALEGRGGVRLTVELEVEGVAHRVTRIAKRPLARAVVIARHAHAALRDSGIVADAARRGGVEALALTLDEPRRHAAQEGLWATRAQRTRALERIGERFPDALVQVAWGDPHAPASDQAWGWRPLGAATGDEPPALGDEPHGAVPLGLADGSDALQPLPAHADERVVVLPSRSSSRPRSWSTPIADAA
jgi:hypothetical protein